MNIPPQVLSRVARVIVIRNCEFRECDHDEFKLCEKTLIRIGHLAEKLQSQIYGKGIILSAPGMIIRHTAKALSEALGMNGVFDVYRQEHFVAYPSGEVLEALFIEIFSAEADTVVLITHDGWATGIYGAFCRRFNIQIPVESGTMHLDRGEAWVFDLRNNLISNVLAAK